CVARDRGEVVFVAGAAPGELVEVAIDPRSKPARARIVRLLERSADRVTPACGHVDACGGCDWMHLREEVQVEAHAAIVRGAVERATGTAPPTGLVHRAPAALAYRTRARLFVEARGARVRVGYRAARTHELVSVDACPVLD